MNKIFTKNGWTDYLYWENEDRKTLKKINALIKDIERNGNEGLGKPEPLIGDFAGYWSRRINDKDRLIYKIDSDNIYVIACRYHYKDKQMTKVQSVNVLVDCFKVTIYLNNFCVFIKNLNKTIPMLDFV